MGVCITIPIHQILFTDRQVTGKGSGHYLIVYGNWRRLLKDQSYHFLPSLCSTHKNAEEYFHQRTAVLLCVSEGNSYVRDATL